MSTLKNCGIEYKNIHNKMGEGQLNKTRISHEKVYNAILELGLK
jgi:hypothetical protein